ncbi:hypothetical protein GOP47_0010113 [Adiantum capillus-veneris]|uniref:peptidylprolyl isomerase n=1 Tax=Adiantum capillus-veneris TaxID=13818 RepID=A0A9D4ZHG5_ADICA|nr:hypothetical protein GOP47_0010113 [Adiantum capillus-veneris]
MASAGPNLNAWQFYITLRQAPIDYLDGNKTVFGRVTENFEKALEKINDTLVDQYCFGPLRNIGIKQVYILYDPFEDPVGLAHILSKGLSMPTRSPICDEDDETICSDEDQASHRSREAHSRMVALEMIGDIPEAEIKPLENVLFICKLNPITEEEDLNIIFSRFVMVLSIDIIRDHKTNKSLCYGFVEFETKEACEVAYLKMNNARIDDRRIHVDFSQSVHKLWARYQAQCPRNNHVKGESSTSKCQEKLNKYHRCKRSRHLS